MQHTKCLYYILLSAALLQFESAYCSLYDFVTCGSVVKLLNMDHSVRLHSHEVKYGSGSGQQSVTGVESSGDSNSYWRVRARTGVDCTRGYPVKCGSTLRLTHVATGRNLHSHVYSSPITNLQEVSAYGENGEGDLGDDWKLLCDSGDSADGGLWRRDGRVRLRHAVTEQYLHVAGQRFGRPIAGQAEVSAVASPRPGSHWTVAEGIFVKPNESPAGAAASSAQSGSHDSSEL
ncbi:hypothetical protein BOX15_Mlig010771g3 [Macrostomum lignano]|uniref:Stromal cell-derived factor 2 n=2 Tax=Macrostomum lignano TaxID=282301 RepID=A0A1I8J349_9PLAT|nr:hypothetical protein BOX15_Mlig010771g3 [Macrostomum lignano]